VVYDGDRLGNLKMWMTEFTIIPPVPTMPVGGLVLLSGLLLAIGSRVLHRHA